MSLASCEKCWEDICVCGHKYKDWSTKEIQELRDVLNKMLLERENKRVATRQIL